jgi:hypothetical protein
MREKNPRRTRGWFGGWRVHLTAARECFAEPVDSLFDRVRGWSWPHVRLCGNRFCFPLRRLAAGRGGYWSLARIIVGEGFRAVCLVLTVDKPRRQQPTATAAVKTRDLLPQKWLPFSCDSWEEKEAGGRGYAIAISLYFCLSCVLCPL